MERRKLKRDAVETIDALHEGRDMVLNAFKSWIFPTGNPGMLARVAEVSDCKVSDPSRPLKIARATRVAEVSDRKRLRISTTKQMLQRLPIAPAQVKPGNTSENLLNEMRQIIFSFYWAKEITKKVYPNIINSIKL